MRASQLQMRLTRTFVRGGQEGSIKHIPPSCRPGQKTALPPLRRGLTRKGQGGLQRRPEVPMRREKSSAGRAKEN